MNDAALKVRDAESAKRLAPRLPKLGAEGQHFFLGFFAGQASQGSQRAPRQRLGDDEHSKAVRPATVRPARTGVDEICQVHVRNFPLGEAERRNGAAREASEALTSMVQRKARVQPKAAKQPLGMAFLSMRVVGPTLQGADELLDSLKSIRVEAVKSARLGAHFANRWAAAARNSAGSEFPARHSQAESASV